MGQSFPKLALKRSRLCGVSESVPALHDDEHVVDADAEEQKGEDIVHRPVKETNGWTESVRDDDAHHYADNAGKG